MSFMGPRAAVPSAGDVGSVGDVIIERSGSAWEISVRPWIIRAGAPLSIDRDGSRVDTFVSALAWGLVTARSFDSAA